MDSFSMLSIAKYAYGFAAVLYAVSWLSKKPALGGLATWVTISAVAGSAAGFVMRWVESYQLGFGHIPFSGLYESLTFFALCIAVIYLVMERKYKNRTVGVFAIFLAFLCMVGAHHFCGDIRPIPPALKSNWLIIHVATYFVGYAALAIAFSASLMYLLKSRYPENKGRLLAYFPKVDVLDGLTYQMILFGFLFLTIGLLSGAVWANSAWGRYWGWDPKETWSLITWFIYAALLHARLMRGWRGKRIAYLSIIGFMAVMFTYIGVNFLLPGLHSYA